MNILLNGLFIDQMPQLKGVELKGIKETHVQKLMALKQSEARKIRLIFVKD